MNKNKCILLYDITEPIDTLLSSINTLYNLSLTEDNTVFDNNVLLAQLPPSIQPDKLVTEINDAFLDYKAISLKDFESLNKTELKFQSLKKIEPTKKMSKLINDFDLFFTKIGNSLVLYENEMTGKIKKIKEFVCKKYTLSPKSNYLALLTDKLTILCGCDFEIHFEIFDDKITEVEFSEDEKYVFIHRLDFSTIYNLETMDCIFESEKTDFIYNMVDGYFFLPFLAQKVDLEGNFCVESNKISKLGVKNGMSAVLTNDKIKKIIFKGKKILEKSHPKILNVEFKFSKKYLYACFTKEIKDRELHFLESYGDNISLCPLTSKITTFVVSDDSCVLFDENFELIFLERKNNVIKETNRIKKKNKVYMDMNEDGVLGLYDYENDMIEFYYKGNLISNTSHNDCTTIKWSQNGCFLASLSLSTSHNNFIQMFSANGKLLWKQSFYKLEDFCWLRYEDFSDEVKRLVLNEYDERIKGISMDILESTIDQGDVEAKKEAWIAFLRSKKALVESVLKK